MASNTQTSYPMTDEEKEIVKEVFAKADDKVWERALFHVPWKPRG